MRQKALQALVSAARAASPQAFEASKYLPDAGPDLLTLALLQDNPAAHLFLPSHLATEAKLLSDFHTQGHHPCDCRMHTQARLALRAWAIANDKASLRCYLSYETDRYNFGE